MPVPDFEARLQKYADVIIRVGLGLHPGQRLIISSPLETAAFTRMVYARAYQAGASLVTVIWNDEQLTPLRIDNAPPDSLEEYPTWISDGLLQHAKNGDAFLFIRAENPDLLAGYDPDAITAIRRTDAHHNQAARQLRATNFCNWLIVSAPTQDWAAKIFPDLDPEERIDALWEKIFSLSRIDSDDPVAAWQEHIFNLKKTAAYLNAKRYDSLHYTGPGTDLTIGLPDGHIWHAAQATTPSGVTFTPNIPTEELFTAPHKDRTSGTVTATMPLNYGGLLVEDFSVTFEDGRVVNITAKTGGEVLEKLSQTDEGAARLGEVRSRSA